MYVRMKGTVCYVWKYNILKEKLCILFIHIVIALKTPAAFHEQIRSLERARVRPHTATHGFIPLSLHYVTKIHF